MSHFLIEDFGAVSALCLRCVYTPDACHKAGGKPLIAQYTYKSMNRECVGAALVQDFRSSYCLLHHSPVFTEHTMAVDIGYSPHTDNLDKRH